jgi:hypothetical protein
VLAASLGETGTTWAVTVSYQLDIIDPQLVGYDPPEAGQHRVSDVSVIVTFSSVPDNSCITPADDDGTTDIHVSGGYLVETETEIQPSRMETTAPAQPTAPLRPNSDLLTNIEGVWGWRADFLASCAENPQTIQVASDRRTLTMRFAKPYKPGSETVTGMTFDVVSVDSNKLVRSRTDPAAFAVDRKPGSETVTGMTFDVVSVDSNKLVLLRTDPAAFAVDRKPTSLNVTFMDANTMSWSSSNSATWLGAIERCAPAHP